MKYFITSDTHSFYTQLEIGLERAGFDIDNPEHIFILDGDLFDRGEESAKILNFIQSLPKERRILIRGNHEYLLKKLLDKEMPDDYDWSNGTVMTCYHLYKARHPKTTIFKNYNEIKKRDLKWFLAVGYTYEIQIFNTIMQDLLSKRTWKMISDDLKQSGLIDWIMGNEWVDYTEIGSYIITHSFIPIIDESRCGTYFDIERKSCNPDWRGASKRDWEEATWGCPYREFDAGLFNLEIQNGKTLVCGHWHSEDFWVHYENLSKNYNIYKRDNLIAIDACTIISGFVNVLIIDDKDYIPTFVDNKRNI